MRINVKQPYLSTYSTYSRRWAQLTSIVVEGKEACDSTKCKQCTRVPTKNKTNVVRSLRMKVYVEYTRGSRLVRRMILLSYVNAYHGRFYFEQHLDR